MKHLYYKQITSVILCLCIFGMNSPICYGNDTIEKGFSTISLGDSILMKLHEPDIDSLTLSEVYKIMRAKSRVLNDEYTTLLREYIYQSRRIGYERGEMLALDQLGYKERNIGHMDSALVHHNQSLVIALRLQDSIQLNYNYNNLGAIYRKQNLNSIAIKYFHKALAINEGMGNKKGIAYTQNSLGATYVAQEDYEKAKYYFFESTKQDLKTNNLKGLAYNYRAIGELYMFQNRLDSAINYLLKAKKIEVERRYEKGIAVSNHLIGETYFAMGKNALAEKSFYSALKVHQKTNNERYQALCFAYLGRVKLETNELDSAFIYLEKAKKLSQKIHSTETIILTNDALVQFYKRSNQWENAMAEMSISQAYKDSLLSAKNERELQALEVEYHTEKKEQQIEILSAENKIKSHRLRLGVAIIIILILSIALGIYVQFSRRKYARIEQEKLKQKLLKSQMNPHFIFNALGSIQSYMYKNDAKSAAQYMGNFASLTRSILHNSSADQVSLEEEIGTLKNYLELERMRMNNNFDYVLEYEDELEIELIEIPPMMIQPFIENAIKHGLKNGGKEGMIIIRFVDKNDMLQVVIEDNGIGINSTQSERKNGHQSMATSIFNQRIKILKNNYTKLLSPIIEDISDETTTGTRVKLYLPILEAVLSKQV